MAEGVKYILAACLACSALPAISREANSACKDYSLCANLRNSLSLGFFGIHNTDEVIMEPDVRLLLIKSLHTVVWAVFAGSILAIPAFTYTGRLSVAWSLIGFVLIEVLVLVANRMKCPLTDVAGRYTEDRRDNFDIYLPLWIARYNKPIFGSFYVLGFLYTLIVWAGGIHAF